MNSATANQQGSWKKNLDKWTRFLVLFQFYGQKEQIPWKWLMAIALVESNLGEYFSVKVGLISPTDISSVSSDGLSYGLMQMTLKTGQWLRPGTTQIELNDPAVSIDLGAKYLKYLRTSMADKTPEYTIRGYNGGPTWFQRQGAISNTARYWSKFLKALAQVNAKFPDSSGGHI